MKIYILHDKKGNIESISFPGKHPKIKAGIVAEKTDNLAEVETSLIKKLDEANVHNIVTNFLVDLKSAKPGLIARKKSK